MVATREVVHGGVRQTYLSSYSNTQQLLKITSISTLFPQKPCTIQINALPLQHKNPPSLSTMLKWAGRFFIAMTTKIPYSKSYTEESSLIALLQSRGLSITDESKAQHYLTHIGYYRLSAYMYPLLCTPKEQHIYKKGTTFDKVMMLYRFDKKLRLLLFNEIEKIEVAVRSAVVKHGCSRRYCHWEWLRTSTPT